MGRIYIPAKSPEDWRQFLADPEKQWKDGYSAKSMAVTWQKSNGFPADLKKAFKSKSGYLKKFMQRFKGRKVPTITPYELEQMKTELQNMSCVTGIERAKEKGYTIWEKHHGHENPGKLQRLTGK